MAGPRMLEHLVDCVLQFEGDRYRAHRVLRAAKNRFGSTNRRCLRDDRRGLVGVPIRPSLRAQRAGEVGAAVACALEGTRPILPAVMGQSGGRWIGGARSFPVCRWSEGFESFRTNRFQIYWFYGPEQRARRFYPTRDCRSFRPLTVFLTRVTLRCHEKELRFRGPYASSPAVRSDALRRVVATKRFIRRANAAWSWTRPAGARTIFTALKLRLIRAPSGYLRPTWRPARGRRCKSAAVASLTENGGIVPVTTKRAPLRLRGQRPRSRYLLRDGTRSCTAP